METKAKTRKKLLTLCLRKCILPHPALRCNNARRLFSFLSTSLASGDAPRAASFDLLKFITDEKKLGEWKPLETWEKSSQVVSDEDRHTFGKT